MYTNIFYTVSPLKDELTSYRHATDVIYKRRNKKSSEKVQATHFKTLTLVDLCY